MVKYTLYHFHLFFIVIFYWVTKIPWVKLYTVSLTQFMLAPKFTATDRLCSTTSFTMEAITRISTNKAPSFMVCVLEVGNTMSRTIEGDLNLKREMISFYTFLFSKKILVRYTCSYYFVYFIIKYWSKIHTGKYF